MMYKQNIWNQFSLIFIPISNHWKKLYIQSLNFSSCFFNQYNIKWEKLNL